MTDTSPTMMEGSSPLANTVRGVSLALAGLMILVCGTRLYLRKFVLHSFGLDDYCVVVALILVLGFDVLAVVVTYYGVGYHQAIVPLEDLPTMQMIVYVANAVYLLVASMVKTSLLAFIMRVFPVQCVRYWGWGLIIFLALFTISGEIAMILQCIPVQATWDSSIKHKKCLSNDALFGITMYQCVLMFMVDVAIIVLPMPSVWKLQMPLKRRLSISALFGLGILSCAAALARLPTLAYQNNTTDYTYSIAKSLLWMLVEYNIGLMVGSLPTLRKLTVLQRIFGTTQKSYGYSEGYSGAGIGANPDERSYQLENSVWTSRNAGSTKPNAIHKTVEISRSESCERIIETPYGARL
ncbi:hypothetical protein N7462_000969 [Penicillium macrosclerotiorum]|uniref:uncharacterized protein n=1 Tax=Penicillium macrosclerotiorum TaxID=303699 RepID=UPI00254786E0|nr:uncharacterized protein N7462_000969 [Penicillium macrosclerotiorum]KAJ5698964.1 hypothetical protein N7462_000969 [Penicillium macrosclerotiorum]